MIGPLFDAVELGAVYDCPELGGPILVRRLDAGRVVVRVPGGSERRLELERWRRLSKVHRPAPPYHPTPRDLT